MIATVTLNPSLDHWISLPELYLCRLQRAELLTCSLGGKGINVARVLNTLGMRTVALTFAPPSDRRLMRQLLRAYHVPHVLVPARGRLRANYKIHTQRLAAVTEINTVGTRVAVSDLQAFERALLRLLPRLRAVVLSGSLPPGIPDSVYRRWIIMLRRCQIPAVLDASGKALRFGLSARPWLVKPNQQEAEEILGTSLTTMSRRVAAVRALLKQGPKRVLLSVGCDGVLLALADSPAVWWVRPPRTRVVSSVGAGDALVAGFLAGWLKRSTVPEALQVGVACAAASVMTPGPDLCRRATVQRLLSRVTVTRLA